MAGTISGLVATTELEAVNAIMSALGQAPFADLTTAAADSDGQMALNILRNLTRDVEAQGWKFNTEFGLAVSPVTSTFAWTDPDGTAQTLTIFKVPAGLASWHLSANSTQPVPFIDVVQRPSKVYLEAGLPVLVFYDRAANRDGLLAADHPLLYIDAVWYFDFEFLPETARSYIVALASQMALRDILKDNAGSQLLDREVLFTWRAMKRDQGADDIYTIFDTPDMYQKLGRRRRWTGQFSDNRSSP